MRKHSFIFPNTEVFGMENVDIFWQIGIFYGHSVYIFCSALVYFTVIWSIFPILVYCTRKKSGNPGFYSSIFFAEKTLALFAMIIPFSSTVLSSRCNSKKIERFETDEDSALAQMQQLLATKKLHKYFFKGLRLKSSEDFRKYLRKSY
jgi:hypothetical protein